MVYYRNFNDKSNRCLSAALETAGGFGHLYVGSEHLLAGILAEGTSRAAGLLRERGVTLHRYRELLRLQVGQGLPVRLSTADMTHNARQALAEAVAKSETMGEARTRPEHLLAALMRQPDSTAVRYTARFGVDANALALACETGILPQLPASPGAVPAGRTGQRSLEKYGRDLTLEAAKGKLDPCIGREEELDRLVEVLCRRQKNNPCLVGEAGVGKTAVVEGLALRMAQGKVPPPLANRRLIALDLPAVVAGTKYRGDFEERFKTLLADAAADGGCVLFIDELHGIVGTGAAEGAIDAASILKPALARGQLRLIGATTPQEYKKTIEKDPALDRRFARVRVEEPTQQACLAILQGLCPRYESFHGMRIGPDALSAAVELGVRCFPGRRLPDKAIDLLDEAAARVRVCCPGKAELDRQDVAQTAARGSGIPVGQLEQREKERLLGLEERLSARVVGQKQAVQTVSAAIGRWAAGLCGSRRPMASFLFLGPSGVGKTELCRALAEEVFGGQRALLRFDMSEYMERQDAARLIGSAPGYVGHEEGGRLTDAVRAHPYAVVLFDEIEKAHPDVANLLLQILEEGELTDGLGRRASFRHTVVVLTGNLGADAVWQGAQMGFLGEEKTEEARRQDAALKASRGFFKRELLGRLDETVVFSPLGQAELLAIARLEAERLCQQAAGAGVQLVFAPQALEKLAQEGCSPRYGARLLRSRLDKKVRDPLSRLLLRGRIEPSQQVAVELEEEEICLRVIPAQTAAALKEGQAS